MMARATIASMQTTVRRPMRFNQCTSFERQYILPCTRLERAKNSSAFRLTSCSEGFLSNEESHFRRHAAASSSKIGKIGTDELALPVRKSNLVGQGLFAIELACSFCDAAGLLKYRGGIRNGA